MRRGTFQDGTVNYAAVGATQAPDLMSFPPESATPAEAAIKIGSGQKRFDSAKEALLSWGFLRDGGIKIVDVTQAAASGYRGVVFADDGTPIAPASNDEETEQRFTPEGLPYVTPGATVTISGGTRVLDFSGKYRVVFVSESKNQVSFALGSVESSAVRGEELFVLDIDEEEQVWFSLRAFDIPSSTLYHRVPGMTKRRRAALFQRYQRAISPMFTNN